MSCALPTTHYMHWKRWPIEGVYEKWYLSPAATSCNVMLGRVLENVEAYVVMQPTPHVDDGSLQDRLSCAGFKTVLPYRFRYANNSWGIEARRTNRSLFSMRAADHVLILRDALMRRCGQTLVMEQDVAFRDWMIDATNMKSLATNVYENPNWDILFLGHVPLQWYGVVDFRHKLVSTPYSVETHCYMTSRRGRKAIMKFVSARDPRFAWSRQGLLEHAIFPHAGLQSLAFQWSIAYQNRIPHSVFDALPGFLAPVLDYMGPSTVPLVVEVVAAYGKLFCATLLIFFIIKLSETCAVQKKRVMLTSCSRKARNDISDIILYSFVQKCRF